MLKFKQLLWIVLGLLLLGILSAISQNNNKTGPCCPFSIKPVNENEVVN